MECVIATGTTWLQLGMNHWDAAPRFCSPEDERRLVSQISSTPANGLASRIRVTIIELWSDKPSASERGTASRSRSSKGQFKIIRPPPSTGKPQILPSRWFKYQRRTENHLKHFLLSLRIPTTTLFSNQLWLHLSMTKAPF